MSAISFRNARKKNPAPKVVKSWLEKRLIPAASMVRAMEKNATVKFTAFAKTPIASPQDSRLKRITEPKKTASSTQTSRLARNGIVSANLSAARSAR